MAMATVKNGENAKYDNLCEFSREVSINPILIRGGS